MSSSPRSLQARPGAAATARRLGSTLLGSAAAVLLALLVGAIFILVSNDNPIEAYTALLDGAFGGKRAIAETLVAATPPTIITSGT